MDYITREVIVSDFDLKNGKAAVSGLLPGETRGLMSENQPEQWKHRSLAWKIAPNLMRSFAYAMAGVSYAFKTQRNFRIHTLIGALAIALGVFLHISAMEMAIIALTSALVMVLELLNTAIESVVDLTVKQTYHELAKIAKDCAAGAVLVAAIAALMVACFILLPPLLVLFSVMKTMMS